MAQHKLNLETARTHKQKINAVKSIKFWLYDTAAHRSLPAREVHITGDGEIWYNERPAGQMPFWQPLHESGEGCYLKNVTIEIYDNDDNAERIRSAA